MIKIYIYIYIFIYATVLDLMQVCKSQEALCKLSLLCFIYSMYQIKSMRVKTVSPHLALQHVKVFPDMYSYFMSCTNVQ